MTQKQAIFNALLSGEVLTTLKGVKEFGTAKLPTRIDELERKHKFYCKRKKIKFKTRYATAGCYFEYQMKSTDSKSLRKLLTTKTK